MGIEEIRKRVSDQVYWQAARQSWDQMSEQASGDVWVQVAEQLERQVRERFQGQVEDIRAEDKNVR